MFNSPFSSQQQPIRTAPPSPSLFFEPETQGAKSPHLPPTEVSKTELDHCRSILAKEVNNITYREVLEKVSKRSWCIIAASLDSREVTRELIGLSPALLEEYNKKVASESIIATVMALVPFLNKPLPSDRFLEGLAATNNILHDLQSHGLISVKVVPPDLVFVGKPDGYTQMGHPFLSISISDWGKLVLSSCLT